MIQSRSIPKIEHILSGISIFNINNGTIYEVHKEMTAPSEEKKNRSFCC